MPDKVFLDSNILIYLYSIDEKNKKEIAENLINNSDTVISIQVINEISNVFIKKFNIKATEVSLVIDEILTCCKVEQIPFTIFNNAKVLFNKSRGR